MKPLYVKKNGVVYKISGTGIPSIYPAANVEYDNTVTSELQATDVQGAIDELSTRQGGVQSDWNEDDSTELDYIKNKPQNLVQDASYVHTDNNYDATAKGKVDSLGTASTKNVGVANGVAELDAAGKVPSSQLPSFVDDVIEVADYDHLPITGESGKIYVTLDTNKTYRWTGSGYAEISESLALGETSSTAYRGDRGKVAYDHATETKLSTATASGLYKVASTAQGHIASLTAVTKEDITGLGIPGQDTIIKNTAYGTCDTAGDVKDKVATLSNATNWVLEVGTIVGVRFTYTNTYARQGSNKVTLNVNNTGAKEIHYSNDIWIGGVDIKCPTAFGEAGQTIYYMYDGIDWVWISHSKDNDTTYAFDGNEFRSEDGNNYYHGGSTNGNANNMTVNGHYYYKSNGPSTAIGASGNDGAMFVQAYDSDNVTQIAQNYENGNIFVRSKVNGSWTEWKKTIANITGNNAVLTTDKTPFLTRQTLNPTGFSGYVREKIVGASYAWNQLVQNGNFATTGSGWTTIRGSLSVSNNVGIFTSGAGSDNALRNVLTDYYIAGHKYLISFKYKSNVAFDFQPPVKPDVVHCDIISNWTTVILLVTNSTYAAALNTAYWYNYDSLTASAWVLQLMEYQAIDLTLAFGSTIADYLYSLTNNGGITKLRDMGCPIDKYTPYGYGLYSVKTSGKKIVGKNLFDISKVIINAVSSVNGTTITKTSSGYNYDLFSGKAGQAQVSEKKLFLKAGTYVVSFTSTATNEKRLWIDAIDSTALTPNLTIAATCSSGSTFTVPTSSWVCLKILSSEAATWSNIQIELGSSATTYEPYTSTTYSLGNDELRGKFDLVNGEIVASGDVKESNGEITRNRKRIELNSVNYSYNSTNAYFYTGDITDRKYGSNVLCLSSHYTDVGDKSASDMASVANMSMASNNNNVQIKFKNAAYTDATAFKNAMAGVYLEYDLATPTTEQSTPFADPMSLVGATTEEYIDTRDIPCPVGAERQYMGQSEDVVEIPSSPQSDGKRILISEVSGGKEQVYWDTITKLNYHDYTVKGDGTTTWGDLLSRLKPIYESLSEDEKTYSKLIFRPESISGNECLSYCGAYWYSRIGLNGDTKTLWIDHASLGPSSSYIYYYQKNGDTFTDKTSQTTTYSLSLRVFVEVGSSS